MAVFKYIKENYTDISDLSNLIHYISAPRSALMVYSNMLYYESEPMIITQWMYHHHCHHELNNLAFHYILSFNPKYDLPSTKSFILMRIMSAICMLSCFNNINLFMGAHKENSDSPYHIHIATDTINKVTGSHFFIPRLDLISCFGKILEPYGIPLIGYIPNATNLYMPIRFSFVS